MRYRNHTITRTGINTEVVRRAFGRSYTAIRPLYKIEGEHEKGPAPRPFLTSIADAKAWIDEQMAGAAE